MKKTVYFASRPDAAAGDRNDVASVDVTDVTCQHERAAVRL